jgi:hypothetical protein
MPEKRTVKPEMTKFYAKLLQLARVRPGHCPWTGAIGDTAVATFLGCVKLMT